MLVNDNGALYEFECREEEIFDVLSENNITWDDDDEFELVTCENGDWQVSIKDKITVSVEYDDNYTVLAIDGGTVQGVMDNLDISLGEKDYTSLELDKTLEHGDEIVVTRVGESYYTETEVIPYETKKVANYILGFSNKSKPTNKKGVNGEKTITYKQTIVDGQAVKTEKVSSVVTKEPVDAIEYYNTNAGFDVRGGAPKSYAKKLTVKAYAYHVGKRAANGMSLKVGIIAVDPKVVKLGSKVYVETASGSFSYGYAIAADTGGAIKGNTIDIYMPSEAACREWGIRTCTLYVLD